MAKKRSLDDMVRKIAKTPLDNSSSKLDKNVKKIAKYKIPKEPKVVKEVNITMPQTESDFDYSTSNDLYSVSKSTSDNYLFKKARNTIFGILLTFGVGFGGVTAYNALFGGSDSNTPKKIEVVKQQPVVVPKKKPATKTIDNYVKPKENVVKTQKPVEQPVVDKPYLAEDVETLYSKGLSYFRSGNLSDAKSMFLKVIDVEPNNYNALKILINISMMQKDTNSALLYSNKFSISNSNINKPKKTIVKNQKPVEKSITKYESKKNTYKKPVEIKKVVIPEKTYTGTPMQISQEYYNDKLYDKAVNTLEKIVLSTKNNSNAHELLAQSYEKIADEKRNKYENEDFEHKKYLYHYNVAFLIGRMKQQYNEAKNAYNRKNYQDAWYLAASIQTKLMKSSIYREHNWNGKKDLENMVNALYSGAKSMDNAKIQNFRNGGNRGNGLILNQKKTMPDNATRGIVTKDPKTGLTHIDIISGNDGLVNIPATVGDAINYANNNLYKDPKTVWKTLDIFYDDNDENAEYLNLIGRAKLLSGVTIINKLIGNYAVDTREVEKEGFDDIEESIDINENLKKTWYEIGVKLFEKGYFDNAIRSFEESIDLNITPPDLYKKMYEIYSQKGSRIKYSNRLNLEAKEKKYYDLWQQTK